MEVRRCVTCGQIKPIDEFNFRHRLTGERQTHCRECQKIYKRNHYLRNVDAYKKRSASQKEESIARHRALLLEYLQTHPCVDCGESDVTVLEFDHRGDKDRPIATLLHRGVSWEKILAEIDKCEVRCANCHRRKTAKELGWYRFVARKV